ncbi:MAG: cysteine hydrolase family protein [Verrucomicrobiota bacterium]
MRIQRNIPARWLTLFILSSSTAISNTAATIELLARSRSAGGQFIEKAAHLDTKSTAIVVIDMWDRHWCSTYTKRTGALVPRMNSTLAAARAAGIQVVFAPSGVLEFYKEFPQRKAVAELPHHPLPARREFNPPALPWTNSGGCECGPARPCQSRSAWTRQHPDLKIEMTDLIGNCDNVQELHNLCQNRKIKTLIYAGVASNMCVCHRGFGMLNMMRLGYECLLVRDLVEAISGNGFDPDKNALDPALTPERGSEIVLHHIERHIASSISSAQLIEAMPRISR